MSEALRRQIMAKSQVQFTKDNEYYTPKEFVARFGKFDYDPATTKEKAEEFGILNYDTIETDGLQKDWTKYRRIWINPPFTSKHVFIVEFITTARFHNSGVCGKLFIPNGRINFESGLGKKGKSPAFGSVVLKLQDTWEIELINK